jgi:hypothetical protein
MDGSVSISPVRVVSFAAVAAEVTLSPNPTAGAAYLDMSGLPVQAYTVTVTSTLGQRLFSQQVTPGSAVPLQVQALSAGTYLVIIEGQDVHVVKRLIKQN